MAAKTDPAGAVLAELFAVIEARRGGDPAQSYVARTLAGSNGRDRCDRQAEGHTSRLGRYACRSAASNGALTEYRTLIAAFTLRNTITACEAGDGAVMIDPRETDG